MSKASDKAHDKADRAEAKAKAEDAIQSSQPSIDHREALRNAEITSAPLNDLVRVEVLTDEAIINGHELKLTDPPTVIELPVSDVDNHRSHGVCLGAVDDDDQREVFDVHTPPEPIEDESVSNPKGGNMF